MKMKSEMFYLVEYRGNDYIYGFKIANEKWMKTYEKILAKAEKEGIFDILEVNHYLGSNEEIVFDSVKELKDSFTITQITHEVVVQLKELFHSVNGKFFDVVERLEYILEEDFGE